MRTAFALAATIVGAALAAPGTQLWSSFYVNSAVQNAAPAVFEDGSAVVFPSDSGVTSFDQATGARLGSFAAPLTSGRKFVQSAVPGVNFMLPGDGTVVGLSGPSLTRTFKTQPALQGLDVCGSDEHLLVISGRLNGQAATLFVDIRSGATVKQIWGVSTNAETPSRCAFAGPTPGTGRASKVFVRPASAPTTVTRYDYAPSSTGAVSRLTSVWNATAPALGSDGQLTTTVDGSTVVCGCRHAIDVASGNVRAALDGIPDTPSHHIMATTMYRGATALLALRSYNNLIIEYDFSTLAVVRKFPTCTTGTCFGQWANVTKIQLLPGSGLILVWADAGAGGAMAYDISLAVTAPVGGIFLPDGSTTLDLVQAATSDVVLEVDHGPSVSPMVRLFAVTEWKQRWSFALPAPTGTHAVSFGPKGKRVFSSNETHAFAYSL